MLMIVTGGLVRKHEALKCIYSEGAKEAESHLFNCLTLFYTSLNTSTYTLIKDMIIIIEVLFVMLLHCFSIYKECWVKPNIIAI